VKETGKVQEVQPDLRQKIESRNFLTQKDLAYLNRKAPHAQVTVKPGASGHPHPLLNLDREVAEKIAYDHLRTTLRKYNYPDTAWIVDVGGNPSRHARHREPGYNGNSGRRVHSCNPVLSAADVCRKVNHGYETRTCDHDALSCECVVPAAYLSVDSLYYLDRDYIANLVYKSESKLLFAVCHSFDDAFGTFGNGEANFIVRGPSEVVMHVKGNLQPYVHNNLSWLRDGSYPIALGQYQTLCWTQVSQTTDHVVIMFTLSFSHFDSIPEPSSTFIPALQDTNYFGSIVTGPLGENPTINVPGSFLSAPTTKLFSFYSWIFVSTADDVTMYAPKLLVSDACQYMMGRVRDTKSFSQLLTTLRSKVKKINMPSQYLENSVFASACLAFVHGLEFETKTMYAIIKPAISLISLHTKALKFEYNRVWNLKKVAAVIIAGGALIGGSCGIGIAATLKTILAASAGVLAVKTGYEIARFLKRSMRRQSLPEKVFDRYLIDRSSNPPSNSVGALSPVVLPPTDPPVSVEDLLEMKIDSSATISVPEPFAARPSNSFVPAGIVATCSIPVVPTNSAHSVASALVQRQLLPQPFHDDSKFDSKFFDRFRKWVRNNFDVLFPGLENSVIPDFHAWNTRFPGSQQQRHIAALKDVEKGDCIDKFLLRRSMFVKTEGNAKSTADGVPSFTPRCIQSASPHFNVIMGPFVHAFQKRLKTIWSIKNKRGLIFASGGSAEELGEMFSNMMEIPVVGLGEGDQGKFDSKFHELCHDLEREIFSRAGASETVKKFHKESVFTEGVAKFGINYTVSGTRHSGDPQTTVGNSMFDALAKLFCYCVHNNISAAEALKSIIQAVTGDDDLLAANEFTLKNWDVAGMMLKLGFDYKPKFHFGARVLHFATYCSARFFPVTDSKGREIYILAPMIGRVYSKIGYYINATPDRNPAIGYLKYVRGDALGRQRDYNGIPFLRTIVKHMLRLTAGVEAKASAVNTHRVSQYCEPNDNTWIMLREVYGLTEGDEKEYDAMLASISSLPAFCDFVPLAKAAVIDGVADEVWFKDEFEDDEPVLPNPEPYEVKSTNWRKVMPSAPFVDALSLTSQLSTDHVIEVKSDDPYGHRIPSDAAELYVPPSLLETDIYEQTFDTFAVAVHDPNRDADLQAWIDCAAVSDSRDDLDPDSQHASDRARF
jgi:hypothetical protein